MNAVVQYQDRSNAAAASFTMSDMERIALAIAKGGLFGSNDPNAVLTLCMVAQAEGKHPAQVMQDYDIIKGKPAKKAQAMVRDFLQAGGKIDWHRLDDECAEATFSHPIGGEVQINWTMARAQKAQLANGDNWKKYPRAMLRSRVVSEGIRTVFPGATSGMYVPEEVADFDDGPSSPTPPTPQPQRARDLRPEPPKEDANRAKAEAWVQEFIGKLAETDAEGARAEFAKRANALAKLEREHPDLHEQVMGYAPATDPAAEKAATLLANLAAAETAETVEAVANEYETHRAGLSDDAATKIEIAIDAARKRTEKVEA